MLKDFKNEIKDDNQLSRDNINQMFKIGDFIKALKACKKYGYKFDEFQTSIDACARKMILGNRSGELLSAVYDYNVKIKYDISTLLRAMYNAGDIPNFLKQADRFKVHPGFENEIKSAIIWLRNKNQHGSADAYRRKFNL